MSFPYTIKYGDTLTLIAQRHGLASWKEIYYLPENAPFRAKRPNPDKIYPGDVVLIPGTDPNAPLVIPPQPPAPEPLPTSTMFVIHRMATEESFAGYDRDLFFEVWDTLNGRVAVYWLAPNRQPTTKVQPNTIFQGPSSRFRTHAPHAINDLTCPAMYVSREVEGRVTSEMILFLPSGTVRFPMPHHLIGPHGHISQSKVPGPTAPLSDTIGGDFRFIKLTR